MFSVVIPYYKKPDYIKRCVDSVLAQTFDAFEIILVDDGSPDDGTNFLSLAYSPKVRVVRQENGGVSSARNTGIRQAQFPFVAFLDADDYWHPDYLSYVAALLKEQPQARIVGSHYTRDKAVLTDVPAPLSYFKFEHYFREAARNTYFFTSATVVARAFFETHEGFSPDLKGGEDIDVWIRAVLDGGEAFYIRNTLVYYSDEDVFQATNAMPDIDHTLAGRAHQKYAVLLRERRHPDFNRFISQYVYFRLYPYCYDRRYRERAHAILRQNAPRFLLLDLACRLPFPVGAALLRSSGGRKGLRNYMKFVIRHILSK